MKKIIVLIATLLLPYLAVAQQKPTTIKVSARAVHTDDSPEFKAIISLSNAYSSLPSELTTLDLLKRQYKEALKTKGISWNELKENPNNFGNATMGYGKDETLYEYRTKSLEQMINFLRVKSLGVTITNQISIININDNEAEELCKKALHNATKKAKIIAATMQKELGDIQEIEDSNNRLGEDIETYLYSDSPISQYVYMLNVVFTVK